MRDSTPTPCLLFEDLFRRPRVAAFEVPNANSDGGAILLKAADRRLDLLGRLAGVLEEVAPVLGRVEAVELRARDQRRERRVDVAAVVRAREGGCVDKVRLGRYAAEHARRRRALRMTNAETQLASFFAKYEPAIVKLGKALRAKLRARLPGLFEIVYVYESQNALVISYSPTERGYEGLCSLALYPDRVNLYFGRGASLSKSDPNKLLQGRGKTVRHVVMNAAADFDRAEIEVLMAAALKLAKLRLDASAKGSVIIKAEAQKQRARRASKAARPASARRTAKAPR